MMNYVTHEFLRGDSIDLWRQSWVSQENLSSYWRCTVLVFFRRKTSGVPGARES